VRLLLLHAAAKYESNNNIRIKPPISWVPDGSAFVVYDWNRTCEEIFPLLALSGKSKADSSNFNSFVRKLYRYGFRQFQYQGDESDLLSSSAAFPRQRIGFRHPFFHRDHPSLLKQINCLSGSHADSATLCSKCPPRPELEQKKRMKISSSHTDQRSIPLKKRRIRHDAVSRSTSVSTAR
jgi:HSF-type DNA-binding